jgi:hypothetical protein
MRSWNVRFGSKCDEWRLSCHVRFGADFGRAKKAIENSGKRKCPGRGRPRANSIIDLIFAHKLGFLEVPMTAKNYSRLAALIFAIVAVLQLVRAVSGWPVTVGTTISIPLWASWIACVVAAGVAWLGFDASRA